MTDKSRNLMKVGGIMTLSIIIMAALITLFTRLTEGSRAAKLKKGVQAVVGEEWQAGREVKIQSPLAASASAFALSYNGKEGEESGKTEEIFAVVMRVETLFGPMPCVYVCSALQEDSPAEFVGVLSLHGTVSELLKNRANERGTHSIDYWARRVPLMVTAALEEEERSGR